MHIVDAPYTRKGFDPKAPGLKGLEWDSAELFEVRHIFKAVIMCLGRTLILSLSSLHSLTLSSFLSFSLSLPPSLCLPPTILPSPSFLSLHQLTASTSQNYDDAFTLEQVEEPLLDIFNYIAGIVTVLTTYIKEVSVMIGSAWAFGGNGQNCVTL